MLKISALNQFYGSSHTLRDVSLNVAEGACTVVLGRNGVGKTTLLKCLVGLLPVKGGEIELAGPLLTRTPSHRRGLAGPRPPPPSRAGFSPTTLPEKPPLPPPPAPANPPP